MAETKHTPAPWGLRGGTGLDLIAGPDGRALMSNERSSVELLANAMLITTAPELLEAAKRMRAYMWQAGVKARAGSNDPLEDLVSSLNDLIAKAEGRSDG